VSGRSKTGLSLRLTRHVSLSFRLLSLSGDERPSTVRYLWPVYDGKRQMRRRDVIPSMLKWNLVKPIPIGERRWCPLDARGRLYRWRLYVRSLARAQACRCHAPQLPPHPLAERIILPKPDWLLLAPASINVPSTRWHFYRVLARGATTFQKLEGRIRLLPEGGGHKGKSGRRCPPIAEAGICNFKAMQNKLRYFYELFNDLFT